MTPDTGCRGQNFRCGLANGCGVGNNQGGGCGAQTAAAGGDVKLRLQILGNFGISAGLPIPLFNGVNDAPTGVSADWPRPELSAVCGREIFMPLNNEGVAAAAVDDEPGLSNCLNRSMSIRSRSVCCARLTTGDGDGELNNFDQLLFSFCPANV